MSIEKISCASSRKSEGVGCPESCPGVRVARILRGTGLPETGLEVEVCPNPLLLDQPNEYMNHGGLGPDQFTIHSDTVTSDEQIREVYDLCDR